MTTIKQHKRTEAGVVFGGRSPIALACARELSLSIPVFLVTRSIDIFFKKTLANHPNITPIVADLSITGESGRVINSIYNLGFEPKSLAFLQRYRPADEPSFKDHSSVEIWSISECMEELRSSKASDSFINILVSSSPAASAVVDDQDLAYHVVKAGQEALTRFYGAKLSAEGIFFNALRIGSIVIKPRAQRYWDSVPRVVAGLRSLAPGGSILTSEEVGTNIAHLISTGLKGISGQVLTLDGGFGLLDGAQLARKGLEMSETNES